MDTHTIKTLVKKAREHRKYARECYSFPLEDYHKGMSEAFMISARIVKHDAYQALDS